MAQSDSIDRRRGRSRIVRLAKDEPANNGDGGEHRGNRPAVAAHRGSAGAVFADGRGTSSCAEVGSGGLSTGRTHADPAWRGRGRDGVIRRRPRTRNWLTVSSN